MATERIIRCRKSLSLSEAAARGTSAVEAGRLEFQDTTGTWFVCAGGHDGEDHDWPQEPRGGVPGGA
jgi:hypothetical protein